MGDYTEISVYMAYYSPFRAIMGRYRDIEVDSVELVGYHGDIGSKVEHLYKVHPNVSVYSVVEGLYWVYMVSSSISMG